MRVLKTRCGKAIEYETEYVTGIGYETGLNWETECGMGLKTESSLATVCATASKMEIEYETELRTEY
jgi:hypothetical protein